MDPNEDALLSLLARLAYREGDVILASGRRSAFYLDAKRVTYHPDGVELVGNAVLERIRGYQPAGVGGPTMGADAIVASTVWAARLAGTPLPGFIVRKEAKRHGLQRWLEGVVPPPGSRVALVEDVVTSGDSVLRAADAVEAEGLEVAVIVALVDREEGAAGAISARGIDFRPVYTLEDVRGAATGRTPADAGG